MILLFMQGGERSPKSLVAWSVSEEFWCLSPCSFHVVIYHLSPRLLKLYLINISEVSATPSHSVPHKHMEKDSSCLPEDDLKQNKADIKWKKCTTSDLHLKMEKGISVQSEQTCQRVSSISEKSSQSSTMGSQPSCHLTMDWACHIWLKYV